MGLEKEGFSYWDEGRGKWVAKEGVYGVLVGTGSVGEMLSGEVKLEKTFEWVGL